MIIHTYGHNRTYQLEALIKLFRPAEKFQFSAVPELPDAPEFISAVLKDSQDEKCLVCTIRLDQALFEYDAILPKEVPDQLLDRKISELLYPTLCALTDITPPWGMLTGIRPVNLMRKFEARTGSLKNAVRDFQEVWHVTPEKTQLTADILKIQQPILKAAPQNSIGIYVSIPFCPSRCKYCSFVSNSVAQMGGLLPEYLKRLDEEMQLTAEILSECGLQIDTVYIGGGTPTILQEADLFRLLEALEDNLLLSAPDTAGIRRRVPLREYTLEAGRPDTITQGKLRLMQQYGVTRISINPQSFQDSVLEEIGRPHTAQDAVDKFRLARETGFQNINMDFIAGLPTDTAYGFFDTIDRAVKLNPESITVHCLSLKKAADFYRGDWRPKTQLVEEMVGYAQTACRKAGYRPYYLYRQKNAAGNLENVGFSKPGFESPYNILMMDDSQTILGIGAGAVTKVLGGKRGIERLTECKYPTEYLARFDTLMAEKKHRLLALLQNRECVCTE